MINPCPLDNHFKFAQGEIDFLKPFINCFLDYYFSPSSCGGVNSGAGGTFGLIKRIFRVLAFG